MAGCGPLGVRRALDLVDCRILAADSARLPHRIDPVSSQSLRLVPRRCQPRTPCVRGLADLAGLPLEKSRQLLLITTPQTILRLVDNILTMSTASA